MNDPIYKMVCDWLRGHYHCRKCGSQMPCWEAFGAGNNLQKGVKRIGGCIDCGQVMVEYEYAESVWLEIPK